jgi:hypothetical protein
MAAYLTRLETRTKEFNIRASCWDLKPASTVKARHSVRCVLARSRHLGFGLGRAHRRPVTGSSGRGGV